MKKLLLTLALSATLTACDNRVNLNQIVWAENTCEEHQGVDYYMGKSVDSEYVVCVDGTKTYRDRENENL